MASSGSFSPWSRNITSDRFFFHSLPDYIQLTLIQFSLFAWTHVALLCVVTQSYLIIQNMFEGLIWFIMPIMMVIINDIMAYMFGFTMGRTPLIQLSPKKTWEGFIGGGVATVVMSLGLAYFMCQVSSKSLTNTSWFFYSNPAGSLLCLPNCLQW